MTKVAGQGGAPLVNVWQNQVEPNMCEAPKGPVQRIIDQDRMAAERNQCSLEEPCCHDTESVIEKAAPRLSRPERKAAAQAIQAKAAAARKPDGQSSSKGTASVSTDACSTPSAPSSTTTGSAPAGSSTTAPATSSPSASEQTAAPTTQASKPASQSDVPAYKMDPSAEGACIEPEPDPEPSQGGGTKPPAEQTSTTPGNSATSNTTGTTSTTGQTSTSSQYKDASVGAVATELDAKSGPITGRDIEQLAKAAGDLDSQSAGTEYDDVKTFAQNNWDRMTVDAKVNYVTYRGYSECARQEGKATMGQENYDQMLRDMDNVSSVGDTVRSWEGAAKPKPEYKDASVRQAVAPYENNNRPITGSDMQSIIQKGVSDPDGQSAATEYEDVRNFATSNWDRMTPAAKINFEVYSNYSEQARSQGKDSMGYENFNEMQGVMSRVNEGSDRIQARAQGAAKHLPFYDQQNHCLDANQLAGQFMQFGFGREAAMGLGQALAKHVTPEQFFQPWWQGMGMQGAADLNQLGGCFTPRVEQQPMAELLRYFQMTGNYR